MYSYQADPNDPNEVSFNKGDMLEVLDATGKWYQVKTEGGQTGVSQRQCLANHRSLHQTTSLYYKDAYYTGDRGGVLLVCGS
jgi:uncharacterized protein YgiM (DUF1202 family)